ncbi:MAG: HAD-IB family phosphatase [Candidatus Moraniibacteriota bacterium]
MTKVYSHWLEHEGTYEEYRQALVTIYSEYIRGHSREEVLKASKYVIPFHAKRTYIFSEDLIKRLREEHYRMIVISGSPLEIVEEYNNHYLGFDEVFGSVYALDTDGKYTGEATFEPSRDKGRVVSDYIGRHGLSLEHSYGIGDTESDIGFLELVENPIAFNPNQNLRAVAQENGWPVVVEKKDVIYEIK